MIDGENIPGQEIAAAVAVGASVFELWSTVYPASIWSGLADGVVSFYDGVVSCYDCYVIPDDGVSHLIFKNQTGGLETWMADIPRTSVSFFFLSFIRPAHSGAHTKMKIHRNN